MKEEKDCPSSWIEERDLMEVYPPRKLECSEVDLEMAICILEGVLERRDNIENLMKIHFSIEETREMYIKAFMLAAECMKEILKDSKDLSVTKDRTVLFFD